MIVDVTVSHKQAALCYTTISHIAEILGIQKSLPLCHHCIHHQHLHGVRKNDVTRTQGHFTNDRRRPVTYLIIIIYSQLAASKMGKATFSIDAVWLWRFHYIKIHQN